jgi:hypothetical protein
VSGTGTRAGEAEAVEALARWIYSPGGDAAMDADEWATCQRDAHELFHSGGLDAFAAAVRAEHGEQIKADIRRAKAQYDPSKDPRDVPRVMGMALCIDLIDTLAARLAREAQS